MERLVKMLERVELLCNDCDDCDDWVDVEDAACGPDTPMDSLEPWHCENPECVMLLLASSFLHRGKYLCKACWQQKTLATTAEADAET